ncbi:NTP transferase domain-containing protein [Nocardia seriolae]|nr:NTP transferase domain-containing protein [Nocardia seriolae]MTJ74294.1 NTP transferase domain-containing protein [Nocardia seriolae]MTJ86382.1 NTP transferase domain-containing protein [Nocardia seriolae]MTK30375.1 NTP transferase domain-containing protein [Nocardia seriolae]MTK43685.1 NTP transferase domain-containing protein [Nocardia seriolae]
MRLVTTVDAIVLAGGKASRMGGVDKPAIMVGGQSMLDAALTAVADCARTVVVGPHRPELPPEILQAQEIPAGAGPVAAIAAGLGALAGCEFPAGLIVVLAADMPFLTAAAVDELLSHARESGSDAVFAADASGRPQYLVGVWRRATLTAALKNLDSLVNRPMKALVPVDTAMVTLPGVEDCDTPEDVRRARTGAARTAEPLWLDEAREVLRTSVSPLPAHRAVLRSVRGAALAAPLTAVDALPRFVVSAMDGYAVSGDGPWQLRRDIGFAGGKRPVGLLDGEAVRIATGAHVPDGTTSVVRDEFVRIDADGTLYRLPDTPIREDVRRRGEYWLPGAEVAAAGTPVNAALISVAASAEATTAAVRGPVRARIVMTGDEIRGDGPLHIGQTRDSIGPILPDLLAWYGVRTIDRVHLRDTANAFDEVLAAATDCDLLVIVGATGGGAADQLRSALDRSADATVLLRRLRLRPGGSTVAAQLATGTVVLGLPGNPFAAVATLLALIGATVEGLLGATPVHRILGPLVNAGELTAPVARIVPARALPDGGFRGDRSLRTAHLADLLGRDGVIVVPPDAVDGALAEFIPLRG